ncbi:hypothetical protein GCK72_001432 [Caenorhabditis remanei]|uniref:UDP-glucuronosyltransferase n=1 Tax=Caenorhabditis remanei TaxID=31234 RepID=A0A6A5HPP7_CAERE|nr:hypothetical protein GCK72_001432 [Caenorhabditis remanei]KAF1769615.1 hypothetical protein GCK72_001432 [Caenorhabditis remanei]
MARLADTLTEAGHNVTFFTPIMDESRRNQLGVKLTKDVIKLEQDETMKKRKVTIDNVMSLFWTMDVTSENGHRCLETIHQQAVLTCDNMFRNKELIEKLRSKDYDVGLAEPLMTCGLALFRHLGIDKVVLTNSCVNYDVMIPATGEPEDTSYLPSMNSQVTDKMTFAERLENYNLFYLMYDTFGKMFDDETKMYRSHLGEEFPNWRELVADASLHFINAIPSIDFPRPSLPKTIAIGGISIDVEQIDAIENTEDSEFSEILDRRPKNMLISFGTLARSSDMPEHFKNNLIQVFKSEPNCTFIWKYETDDVSFADGVDNVVFVKWLPQKALLKDKRMTAFLTHGGLGSTTEAAFLAIPTIMFPIFADQSRNSNMLGRHGMSIVLHKRDLGNFQKLRNSFHEILNNEKYRLNAKKVSEMVRNQPLNPKELVVKYIEFVGKYGPFPLMSPYSLKMPYYQRYNYDIYAFKTVLFLVPVLLICIVFKLVISYFQVTIVSKDTKGKME